MELSGYGTIRGRGLTQGSSLSAPDFYLNKEAPEREPSELTLFPLTRVSFPDGETHQEHEDRHEGSEGDEEDVGRTCRQDPAIRRFQAKADERGSWKRC